MDMPDLYHIDKMRVRASFNKAANRYDAAAILQKEVRQRMFERLDLIKIKPQTILDAGSGTGHARRLLARKFNDSRIIQLDIAMGMLQQGRRPDSLTARITNSFSQLLGTAGPEAICGDLENLPLADNSIDFIWSNLAVQWCNNLDGAFGEAARVLDRGGLFMFSSFGPDTLKELRESSAVDPDHVHVNRFIDMHDIGDALVRVGFSAPVLDVEHFVLTYDDVLAVMRDLKAIGAHNATQGRRRGLAGRNFLRDLGERYERFRQQGKLPATFEVVYGHAWKPETPGKLADGSSPITLHRKRSGQ